MSTVPLISQIGIIFWPNDYLSWYPVKRYKLACAQSDQSSMGALWVAKGPTFLQAEN